jgi:hypothetical protein
MAGTGKISCAKSRIRNFAHAHASFGGRRGNTVRELAKPQSAHAYSPNGGNRANTVRGPRGPTAPRTPTAQMAGIGEIRCASLRNPQSAHTYSPDGGSRGNSVRASSNGRLAHTYSPDGGNRGNTVRELAKPQSVHAYSPNGGNRANIVRGIAPCTARPRSVPRRKVKLSCHASLGARYHLTRPWSCANMCSVKIEASGRGEIPHRRYSPRALRGRLGEIPRPTV